MAEIVETARDAAWFPHPPERARAVERTRRTRAPLFEVRDSPIHGRGVFAARDIPKGTRIIEYTGERISESAAFKRYGEAIDHTFLFTVAENKVIDPSRKGNEARFINHSCAPNCASYQDGTRIFIEAIKNIPAGAELGYDYKLIPSELEKDPSKYPCRCGALQCRGTLLAPQRKPRSARAGAGVNGARAKSRTATVRKKGSRAAS
jgi:SET domain-containing protein